MASNNCEHEVTELDDLWVILETVRGQLNLETFPDLMVFLLAKTRSGKSTLRKLLQRKDSNFYNLIAIGEPPSISDGKEGEIGDASGSSCTSIPTWFPVNTNNGDSHSVIFVDTPGEGDNRGAFQELTGIHALNLVANHAKFVKFLLLIPFPAFYPDADRNERLMPFKYAMQILQHVSNLASLGLVVTKVETSQPWNDDKSVENKILSSLKATKLHLAQNEGDPGVISLMDSVIKRKSIFIVRRPNKPLNLRRQPISEVRVDLDDKNSEPYYHVLCKKLIEFCQNLEYAEKRGQFSVMPSADTRYKLIHSIFPAIDAKIVNLTNDIATNIWNQVQQHVKNWENVSRVKILSHLTDSLQNVAAFHNSNSHFPSAILEKVANIFEFKIPGELLEALISSEAKFDYLKHITQVLYKVNFDAQILDFRSNLENLHSKLLYTDKESVKGDIEDWIIQEVGAQVRSIQSMYLERLNIWKDSAALYKLVLAKLQEHMTAIDIISFPDASMSLAVSELRTAYEVLNIPITDVTLETFYQLTLAISNLSKLGGFLKNVQSPVKQVQDFLEDMWHSRDDLVKTESAFEQAVEISVNRIVDGIRKNFLKNHFYLKLDIDTLADKCRMLNAFTKFLCHYLNNYDRINTNQDDLRYETIQNFLFQLNSKLGFTVCQLEDSADILQNCVWQDIELYWFLSLESLKSDFIHLHNWYDYLKRLLNFLDSSVEARQIIRKLLTQNSSRLDGNRLKDLISLKVFRKVLRAPWKTEKLILYNSGYNRDRDILKDILESCSCTVVQTENLTLILGPRHLQFSDFIRNDGTFKADVSKMRNLLILCSGTLCANQNLLCYNGEISNLFIACDQLESESAREILLEGKKGVKFSNPAPNGNAPGSNGENGLAGLNGGLGGNILIITSKPSISTMRITSCGGQGGPGQNGGNGHCGNDGFEFVQDFVRTITWHFGNFQIVCKNICEELHISVPDFSIQIQLIGMSARQHFPNLEILKEIKRMRLMCLTIYRILQIIVNNLNTVDLRQFCFCQALTTMNEISLFQPCDRQTQFNWESLGTTACRNENRESVCIVVRTFVENDCLQFWLINHDSFVDISESMLQGWNIADWNSVQPSLTVLQMLAELRVCINALHRLVSSEVITEMPMPNTTNPLELLRLLGAILAIGFTMSPFFPLSSLIGAFCSSTFIHFISRNGSVHGGVGGNGGNGGFKGCPGAIKLCSNEAGRSSLKCLKKHGRPGVFGKAGKGGEHGHSDLDLRITNPQRPTARNGEDGQMLCLECANDCKNMTIDWEQNIVDQLLKLLSELEPVKKDNLIRILHKFDWSLGIIFTTDWFLDEYIDMSRKFGVNGFEQTYLENTMVFMTRLERFLSLTDFSNQELEALNCLLVCCYWTILALQIDLAYKPTILNLQEYLSASLISLGNFQQTQIREASLDHRSRFEQLLNSKIAQLKQSTRRAILTQFKNILDDVEHQQVNNLEDMDKYAEMMQRKEMFESVVGLLSKLAMVKDHIGKIPKVGAPIRMGLNLFAGPLVSLIQEFQPKFTTPEALEPNQLFDNERRKRDVERMAARQIEILTNAVSESPGLSVKVSKCIEKLRQVQTYPENKRKLNEARFEVFSWLRKERDLCKNSLEYLCLDFAMVSIDYNLHSEAGSSLAKEMKHEIQTQMYPLVTNFLKNVRIELMNPNSLDLAKVLLIKNNLLNIRQYVIKFVKGLPAEQKLVLSFQKVELALEAYVEMWQKVEKLEGEKRIANFIADQTNLSLETNESDEILQRKLAKVKFVTRAEILLLEYKKIEKAFLQWAFPYAQKYLLGAPSQMTALKNMLSGAQECDISQAAENCKILINHFLETHRKANSQSTNEPWCWHKFRCEPGNKSLFQWKHNEYPEKIRHLFLGYPVKFTAHLETSGMLKMGALKVNREIELQFLYKDETKPEMQKELDATLSKFVLEMTHSGNSYYQVDGKQYVIRGEKIILLGNVETGPESKTGKKKTENDTRVKMEDFVISPYTEWTFRLRLMQTGNLSSGELVNDDDFYCDKSVQNVFEEFADKFAHCVDLHLEGRGKYLDEGAENWNEVKPEDIHDFYEKI